MTAIKLSLTTFFLCLTLVTIAQKNKLPPNCQRVPVRYNEKTSYNGSVQSGGNFKVFNGKVNGQYAHQKTRTYTVREIICQKPPQVIATPTPSPRPTPSK